MPWNIETIVLLIIGQLIGGAAIWGGIRADLNNMKKDIDLLDKRVIRHDDRIDSIMDLKRSPR